MHISALTIKNFRAIEDITCDLAPTVNVIVGPNGVGKTTIIQAIRLTKALLAPRTQSEGQQTLISLGATSPHFPQQLFLSGLTREPLTPAQIKCTYPLTEAEIDLLAISKPLLNQNLAAGQLGQSFVNPTQLMQFLQSPLGQQALQSADVQTTGLLNRLRADKQLILGMNIIAGLNQITAIDPSAGQFIAFLDARLPPTESIFSYFPADRALPMGEVQMQVGAPDAQQQLEAHNSQPQLKYHRLKNLIINALIVDGGDREGLSKDFEAIFAGILQGRRIKNVGINQNGMMSVLTEDIKGGRPIELDSLSSGEKNIALTFLLIARSVSEGGIALFDEPELHLNPAVAKHVLPFIMEEYSKPRSVQFIMCTHSPEILSGAFDSDDCTLLHLKSPNNITRIGKRALDDYAESLQKLGTSVSESLMYDGALLVEGDDDVVILEAAFPELLKRIVVKDRGGRREVEKEGKENPSFGNAWRKSLSDVHNYRQRRRSHESF